MYKMSTPNDKQVENQLVSKPQHVAIIMDGNGRWAKQQGKLRIFGHQAGAKAVKRAVGFALSHNIHSLTLYAFSSENWRRPAQEVSALMELFVSALESEVKELDQHNVCLRVIGDTSRFSKRVRTRIEQAESLTAKNTKLKLNIAANYGGRWDIVNASRILANKVKNKQLDAADITESLLEQELCLFGQDPVDLVIRTGGEQRISNFLIWQVAYAEFYFSPILWPDFAEPDFQSALDAFSSRERRFGGTAPGSN